MKYMVVMLSICLSIMGTVRSQDSSLVTCAKVGVGAVITTGFGYALWRLYQDITTDYKRYVQTEDYVRDNQGRLLSDSFSVIGLAYLTYQSGLSTVESMKDLIETEEEKKQEDER